MVNGENPYATEEQPIGTLKQNKNCPAGAIFIYTNIQLQIKSMLTFHYLWVTPLG